MDFTKKIFSRDVNKLAKYREKIKEVELSFNELQESDKTQIDIHTNEIINLQDSIKKVEKRIINNFKKYFESGFDISGYEVAKMLDVTEFYLFLKLKDKLDFITPPRIAMDYFRNEIMDRESEVRSIEFAAKLNNKKLAKNEIMHIDKLKSEVAHFRALTYKKVFIDQNSLREFLKEYAIVELQRAQIVINESELEHEINSRVAKRVITRLTSEYEAKAAARKRTEGSLQVLHSKLTDEVVEQLLSREINFYSPGSIKDLIEKVNINELNSTVHNTQLYRFLEQKAEHTKVNITSKIKEGRKTKNQSVIRYLLDIELQAEMYVKAQDEAHIIFSIPISEYTPSVKDEAIDLINEAMTKYHERKEKRANKK